MECTIKFRYEDGVLVGFYTCSRCNEDIAQGDEVSYCPHCGAKIIQPAQSGDK